MLLLCLLGLDGSIFLQVSLVVVLALARFELVFVLLRLFFLLLVLDLTLLRDLLELAHAATEAAGKLGNTLGPEEQEYDDKTYDQLWHSDRSKHLSSSRAICRISRNIIRLQSWCGSGLCATAAASAFEERRDPVLHLLGVLALRLEVEVTIVVFDGVGGLACLVVGLPGQKVGLRVVRLRLCRRCEGITRLLQQLLLLLPLLGLSLLAVDLTYEGWYLFVLRGDLAPSLQYLDRLVIAARGVIEGGEVLYLLGVLGVLLQGLLGLRDLLLRIGGLVGLLLLLVLVAGQLEEIVADVGAKAEKDKGDEEERREHDGHQPHPEAESVAVHHHGCLSLRGLQVPRRLYIMLPSTTVATTPPPAAASRTPRSVSPLSCEVSTTARSAHFPTSSVPVPAWI